VDEAIIRKLLGHAAAQTTLRHYIYLHDDPRRREALERLQATLGAPHATVNAVMAGGD
jgi:integrase